MNDLSVPKRVEDAIRVLNEINDLDPSVLPALIRYRVPCNDSLKDHPTVQVGHIDDDWAKGYEVGLLGIINGIFGVDERDWGFIYAHYNNSDGRLTHFSPRTDKEEAAG